MSESMSESRTFPVKPGDWVGNNGGRVAKVKSVGWDGSEVVVDLILYDNDGLRTGRESPIMGGPRTFEPSCSYVGWFRIPKPDFPICLKWVPNGDGRSVAKFFVGDPLPNLAWIPRKQRPRAIVPSLPRTTNFDPDLEAKARLIAAQELRDLGRTHNLPALTERAIALENEAANLRNGLA